MFFSDDKNELELLLKTLLKEDKSKTDTSTTKKTTLLPSKVQTSDKASSGRSVRITKKAKQAAGR